ncbi:outer membrane protein assembly factor BamE [Pseudomonas sp. G11-1]|uniref:Outer membrane protein assembly factor BamE n=1 Tax=Halopseudomonas bauzanensis TaxID=653930 RepID=A0A1I4MD58_9GAMM|nr:MULTISPECIES: outer membrane protein assembly factor BamE [Halopseudomonas]MCO5787923.1 outer membrane protein assembly factor BamE [Pseudomonas sp. G11-1]MCO5791119.1 outer membrane protein assembly factor BamE [Pseudomonas sp. G11-2]TKA89535.1 outer membrane protein assembly factor BamE [Halopseudomonas bauzanensis]WGK62050.1 outer membrane protein assembly factor BamE [Halopseudomonas sp. SMJS2]SER99306.1 outer membrane protein assembly factor BamE [Halopseudomonas bauzanensis]
MPNSLNRLICILLFCAAGAGLSGCGFPGVYKIDVQQGNVVTQEMVDQLRPGMTQRQVRFIMGTPLLQDTFEPNRWDYLYSLQAGHSPREQERISLMFEDDLLVGLAGDFVPGTSRDEEIMSGDSATEPAATPYPIDLGAPLGTGE